MSAISLACLNVQKLLQRGQERDRFLAEMSQKAEADHVLELRQTIQIMQEKLDEREGEILCPLNPPCAYLRLVYVSSAFDFPFVSFEAELSRRNSEEHQENIPLSKKTVVVLKKELAQKTEALNKALKRENELKVCEQEAAFHIQSSDGVSKSLLIWYSGHLFLLLDVFG